jgi:WD40 repeat protein
LQSDGIPPILAPTVTPKQESTIMPGDSAIVLPGLVPEGARARLGRGKINHAAVSPDGGSVALAGAAGVSMYSTRTQDELWSVPTSRSIHFISFSSDGSEVFSVSSIRNETFPEYGAEITEVVRWDAATGRLLGAIPIHGFGETDIALAFSSDRTYLAFSAADGVEVWNLPERRKIISLQDDIPEGIESISFSGDGSTLAAGYFGHLVVWEIASGKIVWEKETGDYADTIALSPDGALVAVGAWGDVKIWNRDTGRLLQDLDNSAATVQALSFSPDGRLLVAGDGAGGIVQWDPESGHCLRTYTGSGGAVNGIVFPDGGRDILSSSEGGVRTWNSASGELVWSLEEGISRWRSARFVPDKGEFAAQRDGEISYFDASDFRFRRTLEYPEDALLSPDFSRYAVLTDNAKVSIHDVENGNSLSAWDAPDYISTNLDWIVVLSPDNRTVGTIHIRTDGPKTADFWNEADGHRITSVEYFSYGAMEITYLAFSPTGKLAMLGIWDWEFGMMVQVFDLAGGREVDLFGSRTRFLAAISPDDRIIATHCETQPGICLYDLSSRDVIAEFLPAEETPDVIAFSPDSGLCAVGFRNGWVGVWEVGTGELVLTSRGHSGGVTDLAFSSDGKILASAGGDGTIVLWDVNALPV